MKYPLAHPIRNREETTAELLFKVPEARHGSRRTNLAWKDRTEPKYGGRKQASRMAEAGWDDGGNNVGLLVV